MGSRVTNESLWDVASLLRANKAAGVSLWSWNVDTDALAMDERAFKLWNVPHNHTVTFEDLSAHIHPADRDRVRAAFAATRAIVGSYEIDFRIMVGEEVRWISARGEGDDEGIEARRMSGIFLDVTGRKQAQEAQELLAGEMSHRVKNLLAIASSLTAMTSRSTSTTVEMAKELTSRLTALGRAHDLVRPVPGTALPAALLGDLLAVLLAPYDDLGAFKERIRISVPRMSVGESSATTVALLVHELATNALKYGSLSSETGTLDVAGKVEEGVLTIVWTERGGPPVSEPAGPGGFGSKLLNRMSGALGGTISRSWPLEGALTTIQVSVSRTGL